MTRNIFGKINIWPFQGSGLDAAHNPGLKPWAEVIRPFQGSRWLINNQSLRPWRNVIIIFVMILGFVGCSGERPPQMEAGDEYPEIYPDYIGVTIPAEIAPMNFNMANDDGIDCMYVHVTGSKGGEMDTYGKWADFDEEKWHALTDENRGGSLTFDVYTKTNDGKWTRYKPFEMYISQHPLTDYGVTYRKIAPGFETFSKIGIYQRCLANFKEEPILEETAVNGQCLNCHYANRGNPEKFTIHVRGKNGGTLIKTPDGIDYLNTKTDSTVGSCTYGYWHPDGRYCAFSLNRIFQNFYVGEGKYTEPWDAVSDVVVLDTQTNQLILTPLLTTDDCETTPAFAADGSKIYFCQAPKHNMPAEYESLKYSLCTIDFDAAKGAFGEKIDTVIDATLIDKSVSIPRPSYDGRYIMYCLTDFGTTPVARHESDLWLMDMATGETRAMTEINSEDSDAYHNWSSDSHWFLFGSKRDDHLYAWLYFSCIDDDGKATKPFLLPQKNPKKYYLEALHSFNAPDFTTERVDLDAVKARKLVMSGDTTPVSVKQ